MSIGQRIKESRRVLGMSQSDLAKKVGLTQATMSDLENDKSKGTARIGSIATALKVRALWLETGRGLPNSEGDSDELSSDRFNSRTTLVVQPNVDGWLEVVFKNNGTEYPLLDIPDSAFFVKIQGDGLGERLSSGDTLIVESKVKRLAGDIVLTELKDGRRGLWRLRFTRNEETVYDPLDKRGETLTVANSDIHSESKVTTILLR